MALDVAIYLTLENGGKVDGATLKASRKGSFDGWELYHEVTSPRNPATGQATGKRTHKPFAICAAYGPWTPQCWDALARNEAFKEVKIECYSPNVLTKMGGVGQETLHYRVTLNEAFLSRMTHTMPFNRDPKLTRIEHTIRLEFVYGKITWEWLAGTTKMYVDQWTNPK
jgi:type VI secretion system secreted protein Hcp